MALNFSNRLITNSYNISTTFVGFILRLATLHYKLHFLPYYTIGYTNMQLKNQ